MLYDEILMGQPVAGYMGGVAGIESRYDGFHTEALYPFFESAGVPVARSVPPSPAPVAAVPAERKEQPKESSPPTPPQSPMAPLTVAIGLPTPACDWRFTDGRSLRASLVRFTDAAGSIAEFKREDGTILSMPVEKLISTDKEVIQRIFAATQSAANP
jgi:hypothetical protein